MVSLFLAVPLIFVSVIGLVLNGYILIAVILTRQISSANNILLLHLGALDALLGIIFLIFSVPSLTKEIWLSSGPPCIFHGFLFTLIHPLVLWTICGLNCDRYYAIAAPLHYGHIVSTRKVVAGLSVGWIISLTLCTPPFFMIAPYNYIPGLGACAPNFTIGKGTLIYSTIYIVFTLLLPATLIVCCNLKILMIARYHRHRIASAIYEVTLSAQVTITHQRNPFFVPTITAPNSGGPPKFRGKSAVYTVLQLLGSFILLYMPYYSLILWQALAESLVESTASKMYPYFFTIASSLLVSSSTVNGFLYGVKNKTLRKTFQNYWRKKQTKSEVNQEIQARTPSTCGSRRPSLTPLGFFTKPSLQRRLSEALLDVHRVVGSPQKSKIKRNASDIVWRPTSNSSLNASPHEDHKNIHHALSCNTLQVPSDVDQVATITEDEIYIKLKKPNSSTRPNSFIFQKFFGVEHQERYIKKAVAVEAVLESTPKKSPRILITRAFSEESDKTSYPSSPVKDLINKKHSSSATTLLERKWKNQRYKDEANIIAGHKSTTKPLLDNGSSSNRSSDSSETSETSCGRICMAIDNKSLLVDREKNEDRILLSWPFPKKIHRDDARKKAILLKQTLVNVQSQEIIL